MARVDRIIRRGGIKNQLAVINETAYRMFQRGIEVGRQEEKNAQQKVAIEDGQRRADNPDTVFAAPCDGAVGSKQHFPEAYTVDRHRGYTDPEAGSFPSS